MRRSRDYSCIETKQQSAERTDGRGFSQRGVQGELLSAARSRQPESGALYHFPPQPTDKIAVRAASNVAVSWRVGAEPPHASEAKPQRHLNLARTSDGLIHDSQSTGCRRGI